jgi:hypothetical protein
MLHKQTGRQAAKQTGRQADKERGVLSRLAEARVCHLPAPLAHQQDLHGGTTVSQQCDKSVTTV